MMILASWQLVEYCKKVEQGEPKIRKEMLFMIVFSLFSVLLRKNSLIFIIAEMIVLTFVGFRKKEGKVIIAAFAMVATIFVSQTAIQKFYELRSGIELGKGVPSISFVAMGMQDGWPGPGWYNNYGKSPRFLGFFEKLYISFVRDILNCRDLYLSEYGSRRLFILYCEFFRKNGKTH